MKVTELIKQVSVDSVDKNNNTPLHVAVTENNLDMVRLLLEDADVTLKKMMVYKPIISYLLKTKVGQHFTKLPQAPC